MDNTEELIRECLSWREAMGEGSSSISLNWNTTDNSACLNVGGGCWVYGASFAEAFTNLRDWMKEKAAQRIDRRIAELENSHLSFERCAQSSRDALERLRVQKEELQRIVSNEQS